MNIPSVIKCDFCGKESNTGQSLRYQVSRVTISLHNFNRKEEFDICLGCIKEFYPGFNERTRFGESRIYHHYKDMLGFIKSFFQSPKRKIATREDK